MQFKPLKELTFVRTNGKIIKPVDLIQMNKKASSYKNFAELREDLSWFIHNCEITYGGSQSIINASEQLLNFVDDKISKIAECAECYGISVQNPKNLFLIPCKKNHPVVWAKSQGFDYWPGKAMVFKENVVYVRYFGDNSGDEVPLDRCYQYSPQPPESTEGSGSDLYEVALDVS